MFSIKSVNKSAACLFDSLLEIMQKPLFSHYKTAPDAPAETLLGGSPGHSQKRLFNPGWPLGRLWGRRIHFGDQLWISLVASSVLEALWASFGCLWDFFGLLFESLGWEYIF